jgi:acetyl esterase/lipase
MELRKSRFSPKARGNHPAALKNARPPTNTIGGRRSAMKSRILSSWCCRAGRSRRVSGPHRPGGDDRNISGGSEVPSRLAFASLAFGVAFFFSGNALLAQASRESKAAAPAVSLPQARKGFKTQLIPQKREREAAPEPPPELFRKVRYKAKPGELAAYLSPDPKDGKKHPAIVWITGGDCNSIDSAVWEMSGPENDQAASAYREAGIVMMFPSLRGGNDNPGIKEGFFGEVNDVLAASDFLAKQPYVDPKRIYLGGHSTGGTLALLAAASTDKYRAVFSFGPNGVVDGYLPDYLPFNTRNRREIELRSPALWLHSIRSRTFVFEGTEGIPTYRFALEDMKERSKNPLIGFYLINNGDHFNILAPINRKIADRILKDEGPKTNIGFAPDEFAGLFKAPAPSGETSGREGSGRLGGMRGRPSGSDDFFERRGIGRSGGMRDRPSGFNPRRGFGPDR